MQTGNLLSRLMKWLFGDKNTSTFAANEVNKALLDDSPRVVRITLWAILAFFVVMLTWAALADIDEVTRGDGRAIPSSRLQKVQTWKAVLSRKCLSMKVKLLRLARRCCVWTIPVSARTPVNPKPTAWRWKRAFSA